MILYYPIDVKSALAPITWIYHVFGMGIIEYPTGKLRIILGPLYSATVFALFVTRFFYYGLKDLLHRNEMATNSNDSLTFFMDYCTLLGTVGCCIFMSIVCNQVRCYQSLLFFITLEKFKFKLPTIFIVAVICLKKRRLERRLSNH